MRDWITRFMLGGKECKDDANLVVAFVIWFAVSLMCVPNGARFSWGHESLGDSIAGIVLSLIGLVGVIGTAASIRRMIYHFTFEHNSADEVES